MSSFEFDIEQDALMCSFLLFAGIFVEKLSWGRLLDRGCLSERGTDQYKFNIVKGKEAFIRQGCFLKRGCHNFLQYSTGQLNVVAGYD